MNKRPLCPGCGFILARCLCDTLRPINNSTHPIILQHPSETKHALNTVALMKKSFKKITVLMGEDFSEDSLLNSLIEANNDSIALLFPTDKSNLLKSEDPAGTNRLTHLVLIDGTWKKAHKIFILSKNLHKLNSFKLESTQAGQYKIRSSKVEHSLSTLEASVIALNVLEKETKTKSLEETFRKMIEFQIEKMGGETYKKNYLKKEESEE